ncbi:MAG: selenoneine synthase SenA [Burkholderiaceae bacterium]
MGSSLDQSKHLATKQTGLQEGERARHYNSAALATALCNARARLKTLVLGLTDSQWNVPLQSGINPIAWEIGHVAWFAHWWTQRGPHRVDAAGQTVASGPSLPAAPDELFDSSRIAHPQRWQVALPSRAVVMDLLDAQLAQLLATLAVSKDDDTSLYFYRLSLFHEDMHNEALLWLRAVLGYGVPQGLQLPVMEHAQRVHTVAAQTVVLGHAPAQPGFAFDNELQGVVVEVDAFEMDVQPVSCGEYLRFVEAGGYDNATYWQGAAGLWRAAASRQHPLRWRKHNNVWQMQWFDAWITLPEDAPVMHINAYEAQAYCAWAKRRLPSAVEWEAAARSRAITWGNSVWEWTRSDFVPYPGFTPGPYKEYSQPWFGTHRELRGGSFATDARMHHAQYRNFFTPERCDVFAGFRTCAS